PSLCLLYSSVRPQPIYPLFPYTTLFRSHPFLKSVDFEDAIAILGKIDDDARPDRLSRLRGAAAARRDRHAEAGTDLQHGSHLIRDRKSTRLNSSHVAISYAVFCLKKKIS